MLASKCDASLPALPEHSFFMSAFVYAVSFVANVDEYSSVTVMKYLRGEGGLPFAQFQRV